MLKKFRSFFSPFLIVVIQLFLLEYVALFICRLIFYFGFKTQEVSTLPAQVSIDAFLAGLEFDLVATTYALFLPIFFLLLNDFFYRHTRIFYKIAFVSALVIFWLYALVSAADFPYFHQFGSHLNREAFLWAASPGFVLKLILGNISYYGYIFLFIMFALVIYLFIKSIFTHYRFRLEQQVHKASKTAIAAFLLAPFIIAGARGRISGKSTTHEGFAIVSQNHFINQVALNPNFTLFRSLLFQKTKIYEVPADVDKSIAFARRYFGIKGPYERSVARSQKSDSAFKPYNVVIVCMESMSVDKMELNNGRQLMPNFSALLKESVYFDRFFSSGIHTFNGLFSTCAAYPSMLTDHGLRRYVKQPFTTLGTLLSGKNYRTCFYSTHDPYFDNMKGFFTLNGFKNTYSSFDLPNEKAISVTGVPDHAIFDLFIKTIQPKDSTRPFISFIMTGSDHGPWAIPNDIPFKPDGTSEQERSTQYADWAIGEFMEKAKKQPWYNNTLFVFLGDHGRWTGRYEMPLNYHHIPLVLHKPGSLKPDTIHNVGYQPDVLSTVAGILNLSFTNTGFGIDLLKQEHPFVYFTADTKIGCVSNDGYYFYELITQKTKRLKKYMDLNEADYYMSNKPKADSLEQGAKMMLDAAEYFLRKDYFTY